MKRKYYEWQQLNGKIVAAVYYESSNYYIKFTDGSFEVFKK